MIKVEVNRTCIYMYILSGAVGHFWYCMVLLQFARVVCYRNNEHVGVQMNHSVLVTVCWLQCVGYSVLVYTWYRLAYYHAQCVFVECICPENIHLRLQHTCTSKYIVCHYQFKKVSVRGT